MALKALFSANGLEFSDTHDLSSFINGLYGLYPALTVCRKDAQFLNGFYIKTRYAPRMKDYDGTAPSRKITKQDAEEATEAAAKIAADCFKIYAAIVLREESIELRPEDLF